MQIKETSSQGLSKTYRVAIDAPDIERATEAELKSLSSRVRIPGFRSGHVPLKVMQQRYGKSVRDDVIRNVVTDGTERVVRENNLKLALTPDVKVEEYKEGTELVFTLKMDLMPDVPEMDFSDVSIEREAFEINDEAIDDALDALAQGFPVPVGLPADAKAESGHALLIDFVGKQGGKAFEGGTAEGFRIVIGSNRLIPGFEEQLIGAKAGDKVEVKVTFPEEYFSKDLAGKDATFDVTVREVARLDKPPVDDEFAKQRGVPDVAALREGIRARLTHEYGSIVRNRLKKRLFDALEGKCTFPLPPTMLQMEFDTIWGRLQQSKTENADIYEGRGEEEVKAEYHTIAERRVKLGLLLAEIGRRQKLQVTREELSRAAGEQASQFPGQEQMVFDYYRKNPARLEDLRGPILEEKAVDWVLSQVKMKDRPVTLKALAQGAEGDTEEGGADDAEKRAKKATPEKKNTSGTKKKKKE